MTNTPIEANSEILDLLCPMHLRISKTGHILHHGPTISKVSQGQDFRGHRLLEIFEILRPRAITNMTMLQAAAGTKLHLKLRGDENTRFKGVFIPHDGAEGSLLNLSFGISVIEAVKVHDLTIADFAHTDLAIEMLYLVEAKNAVMSESKSLNERLQTAMIAAEEKAFADALTGLRNRRALDHILSSLIARGEEFALMQMDLDHFKAVNDTLGHAAGDHVLRVVSDVLRSVTRADDIVARVGGDEFVLIFKGMSDPSRLHEIAERLIAGIEAPIPFQGELCKISASAGTTISQNYKVPVADVMMADADSALYASKDQGRARHNIYAEEPVIPTPTRRISDRAGTPHSEPR